MFPDCNLSLYIVVFCEKGQIMFFFPLAPPSPSRSSLFNSLSHSPHKCNFNSHPSLPAWCDLFVVVVCGLWLVWFAVVGVVCGVRCVLWFVVVVVVLLLLLVRSTWPSASFAGWQPRLYACIPFSRRLGHFVKLNLDCSVGSCPLRIGFVCTVGGGSGWRW